MITINAFLDGILKDFQAYVGNREPLCKLLGTHFDSENLPDYSDRNIQQYYLLRYAYGYVFEYKRMYEKLFECFDPGEELSVTSIGCGSLLDYMALTLAINEVPSIKNDCKIRYRGVDIIDWHYKIDTRKQDDCQFYHESAVDFLENDEEPTDIYIFPKSISEFRASDLSRMADSFSQIYSSKDMVYFLFSIRTDEGNQKKDKDASKVLYDGMIRQKYNADCRPDKVFTLEQEKGHPIHKVDRDFSCPFKVIDYITQLYSKCPGLETCKEKERKKCEEKLQRYPILNCGQAAWQMFSFVI